MTRPLLLATLALLGSSYGRAATALPEAPKPVMSALDWTLVGSVAAGRLLDWTSTEECLRRPTGQCHESALPNVLVHNKTGFAAYETACTVGFAVGQYELIRLGHRRWARVGQLVNLGMTARIVFHNYRLDTAPPRLNP